MEVIPTVANTPISLGELTELVNNKIPYDMFKFTPVELASMLKVIKEYKRYTSNSGATEYIFIKWKRKKSWRD